jgi:ATP-binding protein involved in chromosome partitioning
VPFLGSIELDPDIRKGGDNGKPVALDGEASPHAKSLYEFAKNVIARVEEVKKTSAPGDVIQVQ